MNTDGMIEITGSDLVEAVKAAYDLSRPQGLGLMHYEEGELSDEEAKRLVDDTDARMPVSLDYVKGRACKFDVYRDENKLFINDAWYDHSEAALLSLIDRIAV